MKTYWEKRQGEAFVYAWITETEVVVGESSENPHGVNSESRCTHAQFRAREGAGLRVESIILENFGPGVVAGVLAAMDQVGKV